jgi:hypothetical protein
MYQARNWGILVGMTAIATAATAAFDRRDQLEKVTAVLIHDEYVIAVYDCTGAGTGFLGLTNKRVVLLDKSFGGKTAMTSIPYRNVQSVSFVADKSMLGRISSSSTIAVTTAAGVHEATFRGEDKAKHVHDTVLWGIL